MPLERLRVGIPLQHVTDSGTARITGTSVYPYANELIVELTGVDEDDDFVVLSYQFDYSEETAAVEPKGPVEDAHREQVATGLSEAGYDWPGVDCG
ncbi:hypothetical protein [Haloarcula salinisoli]|uniref:Uncharacterized protein n=1 Tax=Haloarcula salinisoli TaxID=2487746 RepID=A0A8J8C9Y6_9EURY|nr:hypothetical protein [Halomicroarcula salinisoli]MBX0286069.1 hypothetical protein [Halomicroarcula salinisoli]MBX0302443.1 hypothetical protein [Halomicroarcula salinisoli]